MGKKASRHENQMRQSIAQEAARIMQDEGVRDFKLAKTKAAQRLGCHQSCALPRNIEIEDAIRQHQSIFLADHQPTRIQKMREAAAQAMQFFDRFSPRLTGSTLDGTANQHSAISLHLFAEETEEVRWFLDEHQIPYDETHVQLRCDRNHSGTFDCYQFEAGGMPIDVIALPMRYLRQAPLSPVNGRPMQRVSLHGLKELLADSGSAGTQAVPAL